VQAYSPGSNESDLGDEECEPGSVDEAVDDEKELGCRVQSCPAWEPAAEEEGAGEAEENRSGDERGEAEIKTMLKSPRAPRGWPERKFDSDSPAFSLLPKRETFLDAALVVRASIRGVQLRRIWRMPIEDLLDLAAQIGASSPVFSRCEKLSSSCQRL